MEFVSPLSIFIIWHPEFEDGKAISNGLFSAFCRDQKDPFENRIGIPVYFRSKPNEKGLPIGIDFTKSERNLVVCLVDDNMLLDENFKLYVIKIFSECSSKSNSRFMPVAISKNAFRLDSEVGKLNFIRAVLQKNENPCNPNKRDQLSIIRHALLHDLCKLYYPGGCNCGEIAPVKLFISHSKHDDSLQFATTFRDYVNSTTQLKTFFDANDISFGEDFGKVIEEHAEKCIVVAFVGDSYASREWCRREIITAKTHHCPIIVINTVTTGERRSFPYLGNVPTRRWDGNCAPVIDLALETTLSNSFRKEVLAKQTELYSHQHAEKKHTFNLATYPELFCIIGLKQKLNASNQEAGIVLYPDPPLGNEELRILNEMDDRLTFITPLQLSAFL